MSIKSFLPFKQINQGELQLSSRIGHFLYRFSCPTSPITGAVSLDSRCSPRSWTGPRDCTWGLRWRGRTGSWVCTAGAPCTTSTGRRSSRWVSVRVTEWQSVTCQGDGEWPNHPNSSWEVVDCMHGWKYDQSEFVNTLVTELDLVCSNQWWPSTSTALFYVGSLIGNILFGQIADRFIVYLQCWHFRPLDELNNVIDKFW